MILLTIQMKVLSEKRKELSQAIASLMGSIRKAKGCRRSDFWQRVEDDNEFSLVEEWDTWGDLLHYLKSERFRVFLGAMTLLREPYEMKFHTVFQPPGTDGVRGFSKSSQFPKRTFRNFESKEGF